MTSTAATIEPTDVKPTVEKVREFFLALSDEEQEAIIMETDIRRDAAAGEMVPTDEDLRAMKVAAQQAAAGNVVSAEEVLAMVDNL